MSGIIIIVDIYYYIYYICIVDIYYIGQPPKSFQICQNLSRVIKLTLSSSWDRLIRKCVREEFYLGSTYEYFQTTKAAWKWDWFPCERRSSLMTGGQDLRVSRGSSSSVLNCIRRPPKAHWRYSITVWHTVVFQEKLYCSRLAFLYVFTYGLCEWTMYLQVKIKDKDKKVSSCLWDIILKLAVPYN